MPPDFSHYRLLAMLGRGGMGVVYKAEDTRLGRPVALKFISPEHAGAQHALGRFRLEARAASALNHPNICTIYDVGQCDAGTFIAMELLEGESLRCLLHSGPLSPERLVHIAIQIAEGLGAAHAKDIVHRDLKPENVFVLPQDRVKILDFGVAKLRQEPAPRRGAAEDTTRTAAAPLTQIGTALGTCAYMSPEQARGEEVDGRSDLFSLGSVIYEMAARQPAFRGASALETCSAVLTHVPVLPAGVPGPFRAALQHITAKALEKRQEFRYQTAADLAADLRRLLRDLVANALPPEAVALESPVVSLPLGRRIASDLLRAVVLTGLALLVHDTLQRRPSGKYLEQFQLAFIHESRPGGPRDEGDFEAGGVYLPLVVDISALHPDKSVPADRDGLDKLVDELRKHGARAIGIDLVFDDLAPTDFRYLQKWRGYGNVRVGVFRRAVERREAWLGRPEFAELAAGIALPADNPQLAFSYSRRWFAVDPTAGGGDGDSCAGIGTPGWCKEDLIQLPVALWLLVERQRQAATDPSRSARLEARLRRTLEAGQPASADPRPGDAIEFGTFVIDYSYLRELRRDTIRLESAGGQSLAAQLFTYRKRIADRVVLVGDLEDTSDQFCYTPGKTALPGVLIHGCSLATLNRGILLQPADTLSATVVAALGCFFAAVVVGLRVLHARAPVIGRWTFQHLEILVFGGLAIATVVACRWLARTNGIVWPHFLWISGVLALYPFCEPVYRAIRIAPQIVRGGISLRSGRARGV